MLEYKFVPVSPEVSGWNLMGVRRDSVEHREVIVRMAQEGWRYVGFLPSSQRGDGFIVEMDLIFEREAQE